MQLLKELIQINRDIELSSIFEELGNLGHLGLGSMVNAFKQDYSYYSKKHGGGPKTNPDGSKFSYSVGMIGKDSEAIEVGTPKNWNTLKKFYKEQSDEYTFPLAAIIKVDGKPVALMVASQSQLLSINDKIVIAWDFTKLDPTEEEARKLTAGLNTDTSLGQVWPGEVVGTDAKLGASGRTETERKTKYDFPNSKYVDKFVTKRYSGFTQTVREVIPFFNNICATYGARVTVSLILADKNRMQLRKNRLANPPIERKDIKVFADDLRVRLAKYKNSKIDTAEDAADFVAKVFGGGLKKIKLAGRTYSAIPNQEYVGDRDKKQRTFFYNSTMQDLMAGKKVTMKFDADRIENDYNTLYLTVKMEKGTLVPVEMRYNDKMDGTYGTSKTVKLD